MTSTRAAIDYRLMSRHGRPSVHRFSVLLIAHNPGDFAATTIGEREHGMQVEMTSAGHHHRAVAHLDVVSRSALKLNRCIKHTITSKCSRKYRFQGG